MKYTNQDLWKRFQEHFHTFSSLDLSLDLSRIDFPDSFWSRMADPIAKAFAEMAKLEVGAVANPDEKRMVGHYWLRSPALAPTPEIRAEIESALADVLQFASQVHSGSIAPASGRFRHLLIVGIGGSALGPQFVAHSLGQPARDLMDVWFFDNTDPDGMDKTLQFLAGRLPETLVLVISKSGGTKETRNGMLEAQAAFSAAGVDFAKNAVAITGPGSELDNLARKENWLRRFPMWDWVGGRTSVTSCVGLLPAALQGIDIKELLAGAAAADAQTRVPSVKENPAALLALCWYAAGQGRGSKDMVVLPYKDRLELFSRYLQQLIMESLGKEKDLAGKVVNQGLAVYGNKGSTDQHAYIQQLRDGLDNFFATFIEVLKDRSSPALFVEPEVTSGDYLQGFYLGTRQALYENGRQSVSITIAEVRPFAIGVLIALFERAVGLYASLVNINAYHQPGVEAGKKAATAILQLQLAILSCLKGSGPQKVALCDIASHLGQPDQIEHIFKVSEHLAANGRLVRTQGSLGPFDIWYSVP